MGIFIKGTDLRSSLRHSSSIHSVNTMAKIEVLNSTTPWNSFRWDRFVDGNPDASIYHQGVFRSLIEDIFGHETLYLQAVDKQEAVTGVLPLVRLRSRLFGDFLVSMPFFNYGGVLADDRGTEEALMRKATELARDLGSSHIEFRDTVARDADWPVRTDKVVMKLELPGNEEQLWKVIGAKLRAQVRRPYKEEAQITVLHGGIELLRDFYHVFSINMRDLGTPVYSSVLFKKLLTVLANSTHIIVIKVGAEPAAAGFLIRYRNLMEIPWASSLRKYNRLGVNMLLYWEALRYSLMNGCEIFDFGRSTVDSGTYRFKRQWGARPQKLYWHYWLADRAQPPTLNPSNPKYQIAIEVWKRLPVSIANWIGPHIVCNLP